MYNNLRSILGKTVDIDAVLYEAQAIAGDNPSMDLIMALSLKPIADKFNLEVQELKDQLFVKTTTPEELDKKFTPVTDLSSVRNMKQADENLCGIIELIDHARQKAALYDKTITLGEEMDSKDIFLRKKIGVYEIYSIVGLHAIGHAGPYPHTIHHLDGTVEERVGNFDTLEAWGNEYNDEQNIPGRGSFHLNTHDIEEYARDMVVEGWEIYEGPKRKK